jgi:predicted transcriptional regulator
VFLWFFLLSKIPKITIVIKYIYTFHSYSDMANKMLTPCEVAVKCALPSIRAMIANELTNKHNLKQADAAKLLDISQPAISLYQTKLRGTALNLENDPDIAELVAKHADYLINGAAAQKEKLGSFCGICKTLRAKGLLCKIHKAFEPVISVEECGFCQSAEQCPVTPEAALKKLISRYATDLPE